MDIKEKIQSLCENVRFDEEMKKHTTFRIGGTADIFCEPKDEIELKALISYIKENNLEYVILGNGSNVLVSDEGIRGIVIKIGEKMNEVKVLGECIFAKSGALISKVSRIAQKEGLEGLECLSGIPASIGGAVYMNAGAYGAQMEDVLEEVTFLTDDGKIKTLPKEELDLGYRKSIFSKNGGIILSCTMKLKKGDKAIIEEKMSELTKRRVEKQPLEFPSAGSTFKRPEGYFAGKLIEDSGLKGYSSGGAKISEKHAGFVINFNNAKAEDVLAVIDHAKKTVYEKFNVKIEPEIKFLGEF